jgi:hypothetical protein
MEKEVSNINKNYDSEDSVNTAKAMLEYSLYMGIFNIKPLLAY